MQQMLDKWVFHVSYFENTKPMHKVYRCNVQECTSCNVQEAIVASLCACIGHNGAMVKPLHTW